MPSQSWMPRSEYGLELGLRGVRVCRSGVGVGTAAKPGLPVFAGSCMEW